MPNDRTYDMKKKPVKPAVENPAMPLGKRNYVMILSGIAAIILGFILLSGGGSEDPATEFNYGMFDFRRLYIAPLLLLAGFAFEIYAIMYRPKSDKAGNPDTKAE